MCAVTYISQQIHYESAGEGMCQCVRARPRECAREREIEENVKQQTKILDRNLALKTKQ